MAYKSKSISFGSVKTMLIVLHTLMYIVFEDTLSMIQVSDWAELLKFLRTSENTCESYYSKCCMDASLVKTFFFFFNIQATTISFRYEQVPCDNSSYSFQTEDCLLNYSHHKTVGGAASLPCQFPQSPYNCRLKHQWNNVSIRLFQNLLDLTVLYFWYII